MFYLPYRYPRGHFCSILSNMRAPAPELHKIEQSRCSITFFSRIECDKGMTPLLGCARAQPCQEGQTEPDYHGPSLQGYIQLVLAQHCKVWPAVNTGANTLMFEFWVVQQNKPQGIVFKQQAMLCTRTTSHSHISRFSFIISASENAF